MRRVVCRSCASPYDVTPVPALREYACAGCVGMFRQALGILDSKMLSIRIRKVQSYLDRLYSMGEE